MDRTDEGRQVKPGLGRMRANEEDDDEGLEDVANASQGERPGSGYQGEDAEERSEMRQKSGNMGTEGMKKAGSIDPVNMDQDISDEEEMENPSKKAIHGRTPPHEGEPAEISGSHQGSGSGSQPRHFTNLGHGEREATISGSHQGNGGNGGRIMEGFDAGGSLRKEHARGSKGP